MKNILPSFPCIKFFDMSVPAMPDNYDSLDSLSSLCGTTQCYKVMVAASPSKMCESRVNILITMFQQFPWVGTWRMGFGCHGHEMQMNGCSSITLRQAWRHSSSHPIVLSTPPVLSPISYPHPFLQSLSRSFTFGGKKDDGNVCGVGWPASFHFSLARSSFFSSSVPTSEADLALSTPNLYWSSYIKFECWQKSRKLSTELFVSRGRGWLTSVEEMGE